MASPKPVDRMEALTAQLLASARRYGADERLILPTAAGAVLLLGAGTGARHELLSRAAESGQPALVVRGLLGPALVDCFPYLDGHLEALTGLLDEPSTATDKTCRDMLAVLAAADLDAIVEHPQVGGDLLGALYSEVMAPGDRAVRGAFYTPPALARVLVEMSPVRAGESLEDPCAGCGGLVIAAIRAMRRRGGVPELVRWVLGDIDRLALACAGVQVAAHGMPVVVLRPGNALAA